MNINDVRVKIYTTIFCPYCHGVKQLLDEKGISYEAIDLTGEPDFRNFLVESTGSRTVPQVLIDDQPIGGFKELVMLEQSGKLDQLLENKNAKSSKEN